MQSGEVKQEWRILHQLQNEVPLSLASLQQGGRAGVGYAYLEMD